MENNSKKYMILFRDGRPMAFEANSITLSKMHELLKCDCVDCIKRKIAGKYYDVWVDDEALLKQGPKPSNVTGLCLDATEVLVGNLLVATSNDDGKTIGISRADAENILRRGMIASKSVALLHPFARQERIPHPSGLCDVAFEKENGSFQILTYTI